MPGVLAAGSGWRRDGKMRVRVEQLGNGNCGKIGMERLYTYEEAAEAIGLGGRSSIRTRVKSLADRGKPLTVEGKELLEVGRRKLITERGLERLREFERLPAGRPIGSVNKFAHVLV